VGTGEVKRRDDHVHEGERMREIIEKIIDGCTEVKKNPDIHKDVKTLATLVIKDCNEALRKLNEAAEANGEEL